MRFASFEPMRAKKWNLLGRAAFWVVLMPPFMFICFFLIYFFASGAIFLMDGSDAALVTALLGAACVALCLLMFVLFELGLVRLDQLEVDDLAAADE